MNKIRPIILAVTVVLSGLLAYGLFTLPGAVSADNEGFSSERVVEDIKVIAKDHHSVAHPQERAEVREYLVSRLEQMGGEVNLYKYDSIESRGYTFDAVDIFAEFPPMKASEDTSYVMLMAHYDSRCAQKFLSDTVWSYGAADDGYGLGVILESVRCVLGERENWNQGVKVLFNDAEEVGMMGMKSIWENDRELFDDVSLVINVEGRGTYGPALLFETSSGNSKVIELYDEYARYPYTYSLTTVVYKFMPNYTDFKVLKEDIPGMNFSTIGDVNHYHTHLDNLDNIDEASIQHYGEQIVPMLEALLLEPKYAEKGYFFAEDDLINFTIPGLGLFKFTKTLFIVLVIVVVLLFFLSFAFEAMRGRLQPKKALKSGAYVFLMAAAGLIFGELVAYMCCLVSGAEFKPFGIVVGISYDNIAMIASVAVVAAAALGLYLRDRKAAARTAAGSMRNSAVANAISKYAQQMIYGTLALTSVLSLILTFTIGESMMFFIPLTCTVAALILWRITGVKEFLLLSIFVVLLHAFSFYYALSLALSIGAIGAVILLAFFDIAILIPMADIYVTSSRK